MPSDERNVDPSAVLAAIEEDRRRAQEAFEPRAGLMYAIWGIAWIAGSLAFYFAFFPQDAPVLARPTGILLAVAVLIGAGVISTIHSARKGSGTRGPSNIQDRLYGSAYPLAFTVIGLLGYRLTSAGVAIETMLSYWVGASSLAVGLLFLCGAAMWNDKTHLILGIWIFAVAIISILLAPPHNVLTGAIGGLGFLVIAAVGAVRPGLVSGSITRVRHG